MLKKMVAGVAAFMALTMTVGAASAAVIVRDGFTSNDGAVGNALEGRTPQDVNIFPNVWIRTGTQGDGVITTDSGLNVARANADNGYLTDVSSAAVADMIVSSTLRYAPGSITDNFRGAGVGFWSSAAGVNGFTNFTGLQFGTRGNTSTDFALTLKLLANGVVVASTAYTGALTGASDYHDLSYTVNTVTGAISNIVLDTESYSFSQTPFSVAATKYFGYITTGYSGPERGYFDFVQLESVPEPTSVALLTIGLASVGLRRRHAGR